MKLSERIGRRMKLQDLHILVTVVQTGSMGKAAEVLGTSQPNISRSIAELEQAIGVRLLDRHYQGIELTDFGRALLQRSQAAFDELRAGVKSIEFLADPTTGEVRVGSVIYLAATFVSDIIGRLSSRYPRMAFDLLATDTDSLHRELNDRNIDLAIAQQFGGFSGDELKFEKLYDERYVVLAGAKSPWARRRKIELAELTDEPWTLSSPTTAIGAIARQAFQASGLNYPRVAVLTFPHEVRLRLLKTGRFLTICPTSILRFLTEGKEFKVLPITLPIAPMPIGVITLKKRTLNPAAQVFIEHAREVAKPLTRDTK
jgi:DNA-binding transcriptional LysR family regulator